jgi:integrase
MPKIATQKAETVFRNAKAKEKVYLIADGDGLCLQVTPDGVKRWIFRYRFDGRERKLALANNLYPGMSAKVAREEVGRYREMLAKGDDPSVVRKAVKVEKLLSAEVARQEAEKAATTFRLVAEEWMERHQAGACESTQLSTQRRFESHVFPMIGAKPIADITAIELANVVRRIEQSGKLAMAHRVLRRCGQIFRYAVATGRASRDIAYDLKGSVPPVKEKHFAAITDPDEFGVLLRNIDEYQGFYTVHFALRLLPLVFCRPGELRLAEWSEVDFDRMQWDIPAGRMKMKKSHTVPLSRQAGAILKELHQFTGTGKYLFPGPRQVVGCGGWDMKVEYIARMDSVPVRVLCWMNDFVSVLVISKHSWRIRFRMCSVKRIIARNTWMLGEK